MTPEFFTLDLEFPFPQPPEPGKFITVAPGVMWLRLPLPFRLAHVNVYLIEDGDGWALLDTGVNDAGTWALWEAIANKLGTRRLTRIIATHSHPDHIGAAGWLTRRFGIRLMTSYSAYFGSLALVLDPAALDAPVHHAFYRRHGLNEAAIRLVTAQGHNYARTVAHPPSTFIRLTEGDVIDIGGRRFSVLTGNGHCAEQLMLYCEADQFLFSADQILAKISPNVSVTSTEPEDDPLGLFLGSLAALKQRVPPNALVLPGHQLPFRGVATRIDELHRHHLDRCAAIAEACRGEAKTVTELVPVVFARVLDDQQAIFAFGEALAHVHYMVARGQLVWVPSPDEMMRVVGC